MSKGLGKTQRAILDVLDEYPDKWFEFFYLAGIVYHKAFYWYEPDQRYYFFEDEQPDITRSECEAVRRAAYVLSRAGLVRLERRENKRDLGERGCTYYSVVRKC